MINWQGSKLDNVFFCFSFKQKSHSLGNYLKLSDPVWRIWWSSISSWPYVPLFCKPHAWIIVKNWNSFVLGQSFNNLHAHNNDNLFLWCNYECKHVPSDELFYPKSQLCRSYQKANKCIDALAQHTLFWFSWHFSKELICYFWWYIPRMMYS